jgi:hypothetical protein
MAYVVVGGPKLTLPACPAQSLSLSDSGMHQAHAGVGICNPINSFKTEI